MELTGVAEIIGGEKYNSYVRDAFAATDGKDWTEANGYGKNLYQLGNPFLTNLDLTKIPDEAKAKIRGIRIELAGTTYDTTNGTKYGTYKYINFIDATGTPIGVGDISDGIIRPMHTFLIKTRDNSGVNIDFASLRTFSNTPSNQHIQVWTFSTPKTGLKTLSSSNTTLSSSSSIKQLGLIALDENRNEIGRTYYVVYPGAITGKPSGQATTQAQATRNDVIGTFEEKADGGYDAEAAKSYWLYINDANENDFKGKNILLMKNSADVKFLKFEIRENTNLLNEGESKLLSGESFYIESMSGGDLVKATHGEVIPATENYYNLYYGLPENRTLETIEVSRPADCAIVYDEAIKSYKLIFDSTWGSANIKVFDISGKLIGSDNGVSTSQPYSIYLPTGVQSTYVVVAQSEKGEVFSQKIVTKN
ncbi:T9SS C-terminal target domain-containing protein [Riemerella anatipestifer]|uniref:T9SS C-terminal target domain-containing protein n=1 Tax=Riemerella anatipestifer TaxID=34085 RepID=UPI00129EC05E|nr:T9SS C-terminal target domain-containing protein [Riemerella anatipestifer]MRM83348.1 T9SS C-terminal target domain-containing protein [Riemerella anatipestifer]